MQGKVEICGVNTSKLKVLKNEETMELLRRAKQGDMDVATKVSVQLQLTDPDLKSRDRVVKKSEKSNLYDAMDVGAIWLERALAGK